MEAVASSPSLRQVLGKLGLREAGGNYVQVARRIRELGLETGHMKGRAWNRGLSGGGTPRRPLDSILRQGTSYPSHKLRLRLIAAGVKEPRCEECGWARRSDDGRLPLELDHINGDPSDNRLANLRILCPNCHSLKPTQRGRNKRRRARVVE